MLGDRVPAGLLMTAAAVAAAAVLIGCQGSSQGSTAPTTVAVTSTVATTSTIPPTTVFQAHAPQPSQDQAGSHLIAAWQAGDRGGALSDATSAAVDVVFAQPFPAGGVQARGCSVPVAGPSTCVYRVVVDGRLLSLTAAAGPGGWFISAARFQG
jgi:hypothetical protein